MDIGHNAFCLSCHATHQAYGVISICPDCKGNVLMRNSVKADALRDFLGVAPRRVVVTEEHELPRPHDLRVNPADLPDAPREVLLLRELKNGRRYIQKGEYLHGGESDEIGDWEDDDYRDHPSDGNVWLPEGWYAYCDDDYDPKWIGDKSDVIAWQELPVWDGAE